MIDVTGNTLNLYDSVSWWDDANHLGQLVLAVSRYRLDPVENVDHSGLGAAVADGGHWALLAIVWEIGEYFAFIRYGTELDTAYVDTLGDEVLGSTGALRRRRLDGGASTPADQRARLDLRSGRRSTGQRRWPCVRPPRPRSHCRQLPSR